MTPARPTIALCIPAYNATGHLHRLMDSVAAQTEPFDEIFLYDDASTDGTADLARGYGVTVVRGETNVGASVGKNRLVERVQSAWVHFHDADDALGPEFVARARQAIAERAADVLLFGTEDRDDRTGASLLTHYWDRAAVEDDAVRYCISHTVTNCGVYQRAPFVAAGGFDVDAATKYNEDQAMHVRLALSGLRFTAVDYVGYIVYRRSGSMSSGNQIACARAQFEVLSRAAAATGSRYDAEIGVRLWRLAGVLGAFGDWAYVRRCLDLAGALGYTDPRGEHPVMRLLARVSPFGAVRAREALIRAVKPHLRRDAPQVAS